MKNKRLLNLSVLLLVLLFSNAIKANEFAFFSTVQKVFKTQGLHVSYDNMKFVEENGIRRFMLTLQSRRTDIDRVMLVGFYASGIAIQRTNENVDGVNISLNISRKDDERILLSANTKDILSLLNKKISTNQFVSSNVSWY
ncbi:MAG: hypothetical protein IIB40_02325 [Candidatus Marinimicrobia bacterium]|nr:hypothetical protein [Candidatus Neomarinimicrobiota bacterium]MCH7955703.1 hypothetical protein [Candidatus Neomarinimicrobiota bacterium]